MDGIAFYILAVACLEEKKKNFWCPSRIFFWNFNLILGSRGEGQLKEMI